MKRIISWKSISANETIENCRVRKVDDGFLVESVVNGIIDDSAVYCAYKIRLDERWQAREFLIYSWNNWQENTISIKKNDSGKWELNGKEDDRFTNCIDIDISATPFTNSLPVNRLALQIDETKEINVVYINVAKQAVEPFAQVYTRISEKTYRYENASGDFSAEITVDDDGIIIDYPGLFRKL